MTLMSAANYVPRFYSPLLQSQTGIGHGFFTRNGGTSQDLYQSLNCSFGSADSKANVTENRELIRIQMSMDRLITVKQVHGNRVVMADETIDDRSEPADAIVCCQPGVLIGILTADCVPVLVVDAKSGIVGAIHAGWKGACAGVVKSTVDQMIAAGADVKQLVAVLGPAIQQTSYEVKQDFVDRVQLANPFPTDDYLLEEGGRYFFDLPGLVKSLCIDAGITLIDNLGLDTLSDSDRLFSYRRSCLQNEADYGRQLSVIGLSRS